jgi:hypothetical protein
VFYTQDLSVFSAGSGLRLRINDQSTDLTYLQALSLAQEIERWLQASADEHAGEWGFQHERRASP